MTNYYTLLELLPTATEAEMKKAWHEQKWKEMGSLLDFALLQPLRLLPSDQNRSERVRKIVRRSAKSSNDPIPSTPAITWSQPA